MNDEDLKRLLASMYDASGADDGPEATDPNELTASADELGIEEQEGLQTPPTLAVTGSRVQSTQEHKPRLESGYQPLGMYAQVGIADAGPHPDPADYPGGVDDPNYKRDADAWSKRFHAAYAENHDVVRDVRWNPRTKRYDVVETETDRDIFDIFKSGAKAVGQAVEGAVVPATTGGGGGGGGGGHAAINEWQLPTVGDMTANYRELGRSKVAGTYSDREARDAQKQALLDMQQTYQDPSSGPLAALRRLQEQEESRRLRGQQDAILSQMEQRGMGGSGAELAARLSATQSSAERGATQGYQAQMAALQAIESTGRQASQARGQSWDERKERASAADRFNAMNTSIRNDEERSRVDAVRARSSDERDRAALKTDQYRHDADRQDRKDANDRNWLGSLVGLGVDAIL